MECNRQWGEVDGVECNRQWGEVDKVEGMVSVQVMYNKPQ